MIKRKDVNKPGTMLHQVTIELDTEVHREKIKAVCYPNYCDRVRLQLNCSGLGFDIQKQDARNLIEVLEASLRAME